MAYRTSQKVVVKTTSYLLFCNKLLVVLIDMKNNKLLVVFHVDHKWFPFMEIRFFWKSIYRSIYSLPIIWVGIFLIKKFFYTQTQIIGKFIYEFPKKNLISIYGNHGVIDMKNNNLLVVIKTTSCLLFFMSIKTTSSLLFLQQPFDLCSTS